MSLIFERAVPRDSLPISMLYGMDGGGQVAKKFIESALTDYPAFTARADDRLVGFSYCQKFAPDILELSNLYVSSEFRNQRIGSRLLELTEEAVAADFAALIVINSDLYSKKDKRPATDFYVNRGYSMVFSTGPTRLFIKSLVEPV